MHSYAWLYGGDGEKDPTNSEIHDIIANLPLLQFWASAGGKKERENASVQIVLEARLQQDLAVQSDLTHL